MAPLKLPPPARLFFAVAGDIERGLASLTEFEGIAARCETYDLSQFTGYYTAEMGAPLPKTLVAMTRKIDPATLADVKRRCMEIEGPPPRRVNLDPGLVLPSRVVLASAKDFAHRVYLRDGVYAEVTLRFRREENAYVPLEHTFPDYRSPTVLRFFRFVRDLE